MFRFNAVHVRQAFYRGLIGVSQPHLCPLLEAARDGAIALTMIGQGAGPVEALPIGVPLITLIADDPGRSLGVAAFHRPSIDHLARRSRLTIVNAWQLAPAQYFQALAVAIGLQWNVLIVETRLKHELEWIAALDKANPHMQFQIATPVGGRA